MTLLTIYSNLVFLIVIVDTCKYGNIAIANIKEVYLNLKINKFLILKLVDKHVDIICKSNPKYIEYVVKWEKSTIYHIEY